MIGVDRIHKGSHSLGVHTAEHAVHTRLPQSKVIRVPTVDYLKELPLTAANELMQMYVKRGKMADARYVFDNMPKRDVVSWNILILGYAKKEGALALDLYVRMQQESFQPSARTFVCTLKACSSLAALEEGNHVNGKCLNLGCLEKGRGIHNQVVKASFELDVFVGNTLVDMYAKNGSMEDAWRVFHELPHRDVVSWNAMILAYSKQEEGALALDLYVRMQEEGVHPSSRTYVGALKACTSLAALQEGKQDEGEPAIIGSLDIGRAIHIQVLNSGFELDSFVGTTLVDMYSKCGSMDDAQEVFEKLPDHDATSWNAMILGYINQEEGTLALKLYARMQEDGVQPSAGTFVGALKACGNKSALVLGREFHSRINRLGLETLPIVANTVIEMYAKCGNMSDAQHFFDALPTRDVGLWSSLIAGYARHGESDLVFHMFQRMRQEGLRPDGVTFLSVLTVCSHVGLVDKGQNYFDCMTKQYCIIPTVEHYTCMVDLLSRAGQLDKALAMVQKMPFRSDVVVWLTLLGACQTWKNVEIGRHAFENLLLLDDKHPAAYVLMANIYKKRS